MCGLFHAVPPNQSTLRRNEGVSLREWLRGFADTRACRVERILREAK